MKVLDGGEREAGWSRAGWFWVVTATLFLVEFLRRPDSLLHPQFWAEDGLNFYARALTDGPSSIIAPSTGVLWILNRLTAVLVTALPVVWAPFLFNFVALLVGALCCALFSLPAYRHLVKSDALRVGSCLVIGAALNAGIEMVGNITNMPHYMALAGLGVVLLPREMLTGMTRRSVSWLAAGGLFCSLSCPMLVPVAPVIAWQAYRAGRAREWNLLVIAVSLLAGLAVQLGVSLTITNVTGLPKAPLFPNLPLALLFPGVLSLVVGEARAQWLAAHELWPATISGVVVLIAWLVLLARKLSASWFFGAGVLALGPVATAIISRHVLWATGKGMVFWGGNRYFTLESCALIFLMAAWLDRLPRLRFAPLVLLLPFAGGIAGNFHIQPHVNLNWPNEAGLVREWLATGHAVSFPIPPGLPWAIQLPQIEFPQRIDAKAPTLLHSVELGASAAMGPVIPVAEWKADRAWERDGYHASIGTLSGETLWGSFHGSDQNRGVLTSSPVEVKPPGCLVVPIGHGPSIVGQSVTLLAGDNGEGLGQIPLDSNDGKWRYFAVYFSREVPSVRIVAEDEGADFGQWLAVGEPRECR